MLSGADLFQGSDSVKKVHFHTTTAGASMNVTGDAGNKTAIINLADFLGKDESICATNDSPIYVIVTDSSGDLTGEMVEAGTEGAVQVGYIDNDTFVPSDGSKPNQAIKITKAQTAGVASWAGTGTELTGSIAVFVDYYLDKNATSVDELQIAADYFAGNYYVEADTLFRRKSDGVDMPANLTFPNVKIQSNLTFSLSGTGDPSTFTFTMDALPGYTYFDKSREVLCVIQVIEDQTNADKAPNPVMPHDTTLQHKDDEIYDAKYIGYGTTASIGYETTGYTEGNPAPGSDRAEG
jgi:hypothetical protein